MVWCHNFQSCCCRRATLCNYIIRIDLLHIVILNLSVIKYTVASTKPEQAVVKPVTRKKTDMRLVGLLSSTLSDTKLPSEKYCTTVFLITSNLFVTKKRQCQYLITTLCLIMLKFSITICNKPQRTCMQHECIACCERHCWMWTFQWPCSAMSVMTKSRSSFFHWQSATNYRQPYTDRNKLTLMQ